MSAKIANNAEIQLEVAVSFCGLGTKVSVFDLSTTLRAEATGRISLSDLAKLFRLIFQPETAVTSRPSRSTWKHDAAHDPLLILAITAFEHDKFAQNSCWLHGGTAQSIGRASGVM